MAITISIDNIRPGGTASDPLTLDESSGQQTQATTDKGNDIPVSLTNPVGGQLGGFLTAFNNFLNGNIFGSFTLSDAQKQYAAGVEGASSITNFVQVTATAGETVDDLFFSDANGDALDGDQVVGMQTLDGQNVYLWSNGDFCIATTSATAGAGRIVAAFYLNENPTTHLTGQVQMVTFEPLKHPVTTNSDDPLDFTNVMQVSAAGSLSFDFDNLESGSFLWAAIGGSSGGLLVTGDDLNVNDNPGSKFGNIVKGGSDPSDSVNTSQGGIGATIGINAQHFVAGEIGVFTLVTDFVPLTSAAQATGIDVEQINYGGYINTPGAALFISQVSGGDADFTVSLWRAGGGTTPEEGFGYIGNQNTDSALHDDVAIDVATVTIKSGTDTFVWAVADSGDTQGGITVTFSNNTFTVLNADAGDTVGWTSDAGDGNFNRFKVEGIEGTDGFDIGRIDIDQGITESAGIGGKLVVEDDGPVIGPVADGLVDFVVSDSTGPITLNGGVGSDVNSSPYILTSFTQGLTINGVDLEGVLAADKKSVTYYADTSGDDTFGNTGDTAFYKLELDQDDFTGAGSYNFTVLVNPPPAFIEFNFDNLESGSFLWAAVGSGSAGLLVTGDDLNVNDNPGSKFGNIVKGGSDPSDSVNTSQGGIGATIGINAQHFVAGEIGVFTLVSGYDPLANAAEATGIDIEQIEYDGYINTNGAEFFISQVSGGDADFTVSLWRAGGGTTPEEGFGYIGNQNTDSALHDDVAIDVATVTIKSGTDTFVWAVADSGDTQGGITVTFSNNTFTVLNADAGDTVGWTSDAGDGNFNRFKVEGLEGTDGFDIGKVTLRQGLDTPDQVLEFTARATDGDGDTANSNTWQVGIDGTGANDDDDVTGVGLTALTTLSIASASLEFANQLLPGDFAAPSFVRHPDDLIGL